MKTKKISIFLVLFLISSFIFGQLYEKPSVAILGGINFQNLNGKDLTGDKLENDLMTGFHAGVNVQIPVAPEFFFQPGLQLSTKGAKDKAGTITISSTYRLSYIELPLNLVYKGALGNGFFMLGFGPYLAYGIGGKAIFETNSGTTKYEIKFKNSFSSGNSQDINYIRPFDAGGNIFFGYELEQGIFVQFNAQLGMLNISPENSLVPNDKTVIKNTGFGLSLGYRFGL
ncbi:MAG: PorT family protein [Bacteroidia bacterium]|nr:PorT family protein [Bacteroidia bacterium]